MVVGRLCRIDESIKQWIITSWQFQKLMIFFTLNQTIPIKISLMYIWSYILIYWIHVHLSCGHVFIFIYQTLNNVITARTSRSDKNIEMLSHLMISHCIPMIFSAPCLGSLKLSYILTTRRRDERKFVPINIYHSL